MPLTQSKIFRQHKAHLDLKTTVIVHCHMCSSYTLILAMVWEIQTGSNMFQSSQHEKRKTDLQELLKKPYRLMV